MTTSAHQELVHIPADGVRVEGMLELPPDAIGLVLFAHGSGSSRHSPRNNFVAQQLRERGLGTLLMDLLAPEEDRDRNKRFDIGLLADRLVAATGWVQRHERTAALPMGYFGASTGAAAALEAAALLDGVVEAVVSRGGRPDLARDRTLATVTAPTLLLVGGHDDVVLDLNRQAYAKLRCTKDLVVVPGATHLFEEPGTLEQVADLAAAWFADHLAGRAGAEGPDGVTP